MSVMFRMVVVAAFALVVAHPGPVFYSGTRHLISGDETTDEGKQVGTEF